MAKKIVRKFYLLAVLLLSLGSVFLFSGKTSQAQEVKVEQSSNWSETFNGTTSYSLTSENKYGENVIRITSATDLAYMAYQVNIGSSDFIDKSFILTGNIDLSGSLWTPIGTSSNPFKGTFYGEGYEISNLTINEYSCDNANTTTGAGLFGNIDGAKICDVVLTGTQQNHASSSRAKGTLVGKMTNSSYIINCNDKTKNSTDQDGNKISTIGLSENSFIFRGSNKVVTQSYSKEIIDGTVTLASGISFNGYVLHYNAGNGSFMVGDNLWHNDKLVKVLLSYDDANGFSEFGRNVTGLYLGNLPVLRETAVNNFLNDGSYNIYWLKEGYKAKILSLGKSLTFDSGLIAEMSAEAKEIKVKLNHNYGTRNGEYDFKYDQSFGSFFTANEYAKNRAGYVFNALYNGSTKVDDSTIFSAEETNANQENSFWLCFPNTTDTYTFEWTASELSNPININFAIANDEGGNFNDSALNGAVNSVKISWNDQDYDKLDNISNLSGSFTIELTLSARYRLKTTSTPSTEGDIVLNDTGSYTKRANKVSGSYVEFKNHSYTKENYQWEDVNNDDYAPVQISSNLKNESELNNNHNLNAIYNITIDNVCGSNGDVWIVLEREWLEFEMQVETDNRYTIDYTFGVDFTTNKNQVLAKWASTQKSENVSFTNSKNVTLLVRRGEIVKISLAVTTAEMYVLSRGALDPNDKSFQMTAVEHECETISYDGGITNYYKTFVFEPQEEGEKFESGHKSRFILGPLETRVEVRLLDKDGNPLENTSTEFEESLGVSVSINHSTDVQNTTTNVGIINNGSIKVKSNGYYQASRVEILKYGESEAKKEKFGTDPNESNLMIINFTTSINLVEPYINGTGITNYQITIYFEERTYDVDFKFYLANGEDKYQDIAYADNKISNLISGITSKQENLLPTKAIFKNNSYQIIDEKAVNGEFTFTEVGLGSLILKEIKVSSILNGKVVTDNTISGFYLSNPYTIYHLDNQISLDNLSVTNGKHSINFVLGTYTTIVEIYLDFKSVDLVVNSLYDGENIVGFDQDVTGNEKVGKTLETTLKFGYDQTKNQLILTDTSSTTFKSIQLHVQYYLLGWYLQDGKIVNTDGYYSFLTDANFVNNIAISAKDVTESSFEYNKLSPYVGYRKVNLNYITGKKGEGQFYDNNKNIVNVGTTRNAGSVTYNQKITLINNAFYNLGYSFSHYSSNYGSFNGLEYSISGGSGDNSFSKLFDNSNEIYRVWNTNCTEQSDIAQKTLTLTANWEIIKYAVIIDGEGKAELSIGQNIYYTTELDKKDGIATYYFENQEDNFALKNGTKGAMKRGYVVTGYEIKHDGKVENFGRYDKNHSTLVNNFYTLTPENFLKFIDSDYRFTANDQENAIQVTTIREAGKYLLILDTYLEKDDKGYFSYTWDESKDNANLGQIDNESGVISINITFDQVPVNLATAIECGALKINRDGYIVNGWAISSNGVQQSIFDTTKIYSNPSDTNIVPIWNFKNSTYTSILNFTEDVKEENPTFYLEKSKEVLEGNYTGGDVTDLINATSNGEMVTDYWFEIYLEDNLVKTISKETIYDYSTYPVAGNYKVLFKVKLIDTLNRVVTAQTNTITSLERKFTISKNTLYFYAHDLHTIYNGTSEFVPNTITQAGYDNTFGSFIYKYDWDGTILSDIEVKEKIGDTDVWFNNFVVVDNSPENKFNAGSGKTLQMTLKNIDGHFGNRELDKIFSNVTKAQDGSYITQILGELTIDKARFTISFPKGSAYYIEGVQTLVYDNQESYTFSYGQVTFEYTYDKLMLVPNAQPGKYVGSGFNHIIDARSFTFVNDEDFVIKNHIEDRDSNFEWVISDQSEFILMDSSSALKFDYIARYISATNGNLDSSLSSSFSGIRETMSISNILVDGKKVEIPSLEQFPIYADNEVILYVAGKDTNKIYTYINKSIISAHSLSFDIVINISSERDDILKTLIWTKTDSSISTIKGGFETMADYSKNVIPVYADTNASFMAVLTDVVKVTLDYNTGKNASGKTSEEIYVSSVSSVEISNPTHEYSGLVFNGYTQEASSNITLIEKTSSKVFRTSNGGKNEVFKAKWNFTSIDASLVKAKHEYFASKTAQDILINEIANINLPVGVTNSTYTLSKGNVKYEYSSISSKFTLCDERGYFVPSMSGQYKLNLNIVYSDSIQAPQTQSLDLEFEIEISINTIEFVYNGSNLTYANKNQENLITLDYKVNGEKKNDVNLTLLSTFDNTLSDYNSYVTITNAENQNEDLFNAGSYTLTFAVDSKLSEIYKFNTNTITIIIEKYIITLSDYADTINAQLFKVFGQTEPNPIKANLVIEENASEEVSISFTRENTSDAINEEGYPVVCSGVIGDDSTNYTIDASGSEFTFKILVPSSNLQVEIKESFSYVYNGNALSNFAVSFDQEKMLYILTASAGSENLSITFDIYYVENGIKIEIPEQQKEQYTQEVVFSSSNAGADVGKYEFSVNLVEGSTWEGIDIVNPLDAIIEVTPRELTLTKIQKVFDRNTNIISSGVTFDNLIQGDSVVLSGSYSSELAGNDIPMKNLALAGTKAGNYTLKNPEFKGVITKAQVDEISFDLNKKTTTYGLLKSTTALGDFFALSEGYTFTNGEENDIRNGYIQLSSFKVADNDLSTAGYINAGDIEVKFIFTSDNFSGLNENGYGVTIKVNPYSLDLSLIKISKEYNENSLLPTHLNTSLEGYILQGDIASIDLTKGGYEDKEIGVGKKVTIVLTGKDSANYLVVDNVTGDITPYQITLNVIADRENQDLVTDGSFVDDGQEVVVSDRVFYLDYPSYTPEQAIQSLSLPQRRGYKAVGWKYYDEATDSYILITKDNLNDIFKEIAEDDVEENSLDIYAVWEIELLNIVIEQTNIQTLESTATDNKIRYYSSFEISALAERGYKITNVNIAQGQVTESSLSDIGKNSGRFTFTKVITNLKIVITTKEINVTFDAKLNLPEYTKRIDASNLSVTYSYTTLNLLSQADLPQVRVTKGTYAFAGYTYGQENTQVGDKTLQAVVDQLYSGENLTTDVKITINANWIGENYLITFNPNGGTINGELTMNAVYGSALPQTMPTVTQAGRSYTWTCQDITYNDGDILRSVGNLVEDVYHVTFIATWTNNTYKLKVNFDDKLSVFANNVPATNGQTFDIVYSENEVDFIIRPNNGYIYQVDKTLLNGQCNEFKDLITVFNLVDNGEITFSSVVDDNYLTLDTNSNVTQIKGYLVTAEGDNELEISDNILVAKTESVVKVEFTAKKGWIFSEKSISFAGNGKFTKEISQDKKVLTVIWSEFVDDAKIVVVPDADDNIVTTGNLTDIFESLSFNGYAVDLTGNTYTIKTAVTLNISGVLKYGYMDGNVNSGETNYVRAESVKNTFSASDRHYHFSAIVENFDQDFTLTFTNSPRIFKFALSIKEGQEIYGEILSNPSQEVMFGQDLSLTQDELLPTYMFDKWIYHNGKVLNDIPNQNITLSSQHKEMLECVSEGETINIEATYKRKVVKMTFSASGKGSYTISQTLDNVFHSVGNAFPVNAEIYMGQYLDFVITPQDGYEIDKVMFDDTQVPPADYGYNLESGEMKVFIDLENPITKVDISFKASVARVYIQAGVRVNYTDYLGTTSGGYIYLTDKDGNKLGEELYLAGKNGYVVSGGDYSVSSFTDETLYFIVECKNGFTQSIGASEGVVINEYTIGEKTIYSFSNIRNLSHIVALFTAKENVINVKFALDGQTNLAHAGIIEADTSSNFVSAIPYRGDNISISIITGSDLILSVNSSLAYSLAGDENGKVKYLITYPGEDEFLPEQILVGDITPSDSLRTGYTDTATFKIDNVNTNASIIFFVNPCEYSIKFKVYDQTEVVMTEKVLYGQDWSTDLFTEEEKQIVFASRTGYTFLGYYTKPNGQGTQYIDKDGKVVSRWLEDGYFFNGSLYEPEGNFEVDSNTYTLYANWLYNRAEVTIQFLPTEVANIERSYNISHVITNLNSLSAWTTQDNRWYAEIIVGATLQIKPLVFDGYVFDSWIVTYDGGEGITKPETFNLEKIQTGKYVIKGIYRPKYEIYTLNENNALTDGGRADVVQDGQVLIEGNFDCQKSLTLMAVPNEGYRFLYFVDNNTAQKMYANIDANGVATYTYSSLLSKPISVTAVFVGKNITINLDTLEIRSCHELISVKVNGKVVDYTQAISACVGDTISVEIKKKNGYNFEVSGATFTKTIADNGNYLFTYKFSLAGLVEVGEGYTIDIKFSAPKENIRFVFFIELDQAVDQVETGKSGSLMIVNNDGKNINVQIGSFYTYLYGDQFMLKINANENYQLKYIALSTTDMTFNVTDRVANNILIVDKILMDIYFDYEIKITAMMERLVWTDVRSQRFEGKGTKESPYYISSANDFALLSYLVNNAVENIYDNLYSECYYVVTRDIDFKGRYFEPIGTEGNPFNGTIELGGHKYLNVSHYKDYTDPVPSYYGLFWHLGRQAKIIADKPSYVLLIVVISGVVVGIGVTIFLVFFMHARKKKLLQQLANQ